MHVISETPGRKQLLSNCSLYLPIAPGPLPAFLALQEQQHTSRSYVTLGWARNRRTWCALQGGCEPTVLGKNKNNRVWELGRGTIHLFTEFSPREEASPCETASSPLGCFREEGSTQVKCARSIFVASKESVSHTVTGDIPTQPKKPSGVKFTHGLMEGVFNPYIM